MKFRQGSIQELCRLLERQCPATWKRITEKRYQLPDYKVANYANQLALNQDWIYRFWQTLTTLPYEEDTESEHNILLGVLFVNQALGLKSNRPTYFLKPDHGAALMRTDLPADLSFSDIRWRHPQLRIMLPLNLIRYYNTVRKTEETCVCIDLARTGTETSIFYPKEFAKELDLMPNLYRIRQELGLGLVEEACFFQESPRIAQTISSQSLSNDPLIILAYSLTEPSFKTLLEAQERFDLTLQELVDTQLLHERMAHLGLQCLLYMSREEEEPPETIIRPARIEGHHLKSSIVRAKFVDEYCHKVQPGKAQVIASYQSQGELRTPVAHWVRGHWRHQPYGPAQSLRKLIWIQPYQTTGAEYEKEYLNQWNPSTRSR